ncbi:MAG: ABC transporter substrate-binding protein [Holosporaceae bacterium]|nr:ABC transporter substrate-binding protein [Holosporaceae bacterium]
MDNYIKKYIHVLSVSVFLLFGCDDGRKNENAAAGSIKFAISADYPPFTYYSDGNLTGLDIEFAQLLAKELGKTAVFEDMQFGAILLSVQDGAVDAAIGAIEPSEEKKKKCDFSDSYYNTGWALVYRKGSTATSLGQLAKSKVVYQNGSIGHRDLLREKAPLAELVAMDNMNAAIEALKAGQVDYILMDDVPAKKFCEKNAELASSFVAESKVGYVIMLKKGSALRTRLNEAIKKLKSDGALEKLMTKYI